MSRSAIKYHMQYFFSVSSQVCGTTIFLLSFLWSVLYSLMLNAGGAAVRALVEKARSAHVWPRLRKPFTNGWHLFRYILEGSRPGW